jgi:hypothetical protein
MAITKKLRK